jgi:hypothetical protein
VKAQDRYLLSSFQIWARYLGELQGVAPRGAGGKEMATQASVATAPRQNLLATHPLISFFMAYACSWLVWMLVVLSEDGVGLLPFSPFSSSPLLAIVALPVGVYLELIS